MQTLLRHLNFANVVSTLAVFLALGGGSVAIAGVAANSVDSESVVDDSLKSRDLKGGEAVKTSDVVDEELKDADIATDGITASEIAFGAVGSDEVANNSVRHDEILNGTITDLDIEDGEITGADIADGLVDASEFGEDAFYRAASSEFDGEVTFEDNDDGQNADYALEEVANSCTKSVRPTVITGELVSADVRWDGTFGENPDEDERFVSEIKLNMNTDTVTVRGGSDMGAQGGDSFVVLKASAVCLGF